MNPEDKEKIKVDKIDFDNNITTSSRYDREFAESPATMTIYAMLSMKIEPPASWNEKPPDEVTIIKNEVCKPIEKQFEEYIKSIKEKARMWNCIIPWLRNNLTKEQLDLLGVLADEESMKILKYLVEDEK